MNNSLQAALTKIKNDEDKEQSINTKNRVYNMIEKVREQKKLYKYTNI